MDVDAEGDNPTSFAYYKSSYDGSYRAYLPYLRTSTKPAENEIPDDKKGKKDDAEAE